jgi:hypothetical protein
MKKLTVLFMILAVTITAFGQYTEDKLPSGLIEATSLDTTDYMIIQKNGESYVKAAQLRYLRNLISDEIVENIETVDSVDGQSGQFIISDGNNWLEPTAAKYEGYDAFTFGQRFSGTSVGSGSFVIQGGEASGTKSMAVFGGEATNTSTLSIGRLNRVTGLRSSILNGLSDTITGAYSTIGNGYECTITSDYSFIGSGRQCEITGGYAFNGAGNNNIVSGSICFNGAGDGNRVTQNGAFNGSGHSNTVSGSDAANVNGGFNSVSGMDAFNGTGYRDTVTGQYAFNGAGYTNMVTGQSAFNGAGRGMYSQSYAEHTFGLFNDTVASHTPDSYVATDRLITIGNGTASDARSNALVMLKNGDTEANGIWEFKGIQIKDTSYIGTVLNTGLIANNSGGDLIQCDGSQWNKFAKIINGNITADTFTLSDMNTAPASATATGTKGEIRVTADYIYVCTATNTWKRAALATW